MHLLNQNVKTFKKLASWYARLVLGIPEEDNQEIFEDGMLSLDLDLSVDVDGNPDLNNSESDHQNRMSIEGSQQDQSEPYSDDKQVYLDEEELSDNKDVSLRYDIDEMNPSRTNPVELSLKNLEQDQNDSKSDDSSIQSASDEEVMKRPNWNVDFVLWANKEYTLVSHTRPFESGYNHFAHSNLAFFYFCLG